MQVGLLTVPWIDGVKPMTRRKIVSAALIGAMALGAVSVSAVPSSAGAFTTFLRIIFTPTPTGGCKSDGSACKDMIQR